MTYSKFQQQRIDKGLCKDCGSERGQNGTKVHCRPCADKHSIASTAAKQRARAKYGEGQCRTCGADVSGSANKTCSRCLANVAKHKRLYMQAVRKTKLENGLCLECLQDAYPEAKRCWKHIMANSLRKHGIPASEWQTFWKKLEDQRFKCFYTGIDLIPEKNLSLDHLTPKSKGGSNELSNCVWCDRNINAFKNDFTLEEFVSQCKTIATRFEN